MNGIDVSHHQGIISWQSVAKSGIEFAIIKTGGSDKGFYKDSKFEDNYAGARQAGLHVGAYYYVGKNCVTRYAGISDAQRFIDLLKGKQFDFPVFIDLESTPTSAKAGATEAVIGFCETLEAAGYYAGIYASDISGFKDRLNIDKLSKWCKWVARYGSEPKYVDQYGIWQKSETGRVGGIPGNVDLDVCYVDYSVAIKAAGKNGYQKTAETAAQPVVQPAVHDTVQVTMQVNGKTYSGVLVAVE